MPVRIKISGLWELLWWFPGWGCERAAARSHPHPGLLTEIPEEGRFLQGQFFKKIVKKS